ncbi:MAG: DUF2169 domain-containing protein [SAR324 cluster bacterium]|nr:DUF2169 domain-containing protein [SAR324 cluster bacterium]
MDESVSLWGIKPLDLGLQYKAFLWQKQPKFSVGVMLAFPLAGGVPILEPDMWKALSTQLPPDGALDDGMPKPRGEYVVMGSYHAPGGKPVSRGAVKIKLGDLEKSLLIYGHRYWENLGISKPSLLTSLPIQYQYAFGGGNFPKNPKGKGVAPVTNEEGVSMHPLPNIEDPNHPILSKRDQPEPAGLNGLDIMHPDRQAKAGTYDGEWVEKYAPGLAKDLDWEFFNVAPPDQRIEGFFKGGEPFEIHNMHPEKSVFRGKLPSYRPRAFIYQRTDDGLKFREVPNMRMDTVIFVPAVEMGILLWRGVIDISIDDATDVRNIMIAYENLKDNPRTIEHYEDQLQKRTSPTQRIRYLLNTTDLIPLDHRCGFQRLLDGNSNDKMQSLMLKNMEAQRQIQIDAAMKQLDQKLEEGRNQMLMMLAVQNIDPTPYLEQWDDAVNQPPPEEPEIKAFMEWLEGILPGITTGELDLTRMDLTKMSEIQPRLQEIADHKKEAAKQQLLEKLEEFKQQELTDSKDPEMIQIAEKTKNETIQKFEAAIQSMDQVPPLPRAPGIEALDEAKLKMSEARQQVIDGIEKARQEGKEIEYPEEMSAMEGSLDKAEEMLKALPETFKKLYIMGAHYMEPGASPHAVPLGLIAAQVLENAKSRKSMANGDYACIDLSGHDLSGVDFSGSFMEDVNFARSNLSGANLSGCVMARANFTGTNLAGANLDGANIGAAQLIETDFTDAILTNAILSKSTMRKTKFLRAQMKGAQIMDAVVEQVDFSEIDMFQTIFLKMELNQCLFRNANIPNCMFIQTHTPKCDFTGANLNECLWLESRVDESIFKNAVMTNARFVGGCSLIKANFTGANMERANLMRTQLTDADLSHANLSMVLFESAKMERANLEGSNAFRAVFMKADLSHARIENVNLMEGSLMKAHVVDASFRNSNLFGCELMNIVVGNTDFRDANLDRTLFKKWRPS